MSKSKSEAGQSQLLISLLIITFGAAIVLATNSTINGSFSKAPSFPQILEKEFSIEVFANTSILIETGEKVKITLLLDNGTALPGQEIKAYLNDSQIFSGITDSEGSVEFEFNEIGILKAVFEGNSSLFLNPCFSEIEVKKVEENLSEENVTIPEVNLSYLTIFTDKEEYSLNETVNVFGELILEGKRENAHANLTLEFNSSVIFSEEVEIINGSFSYSFAANLEEEGVYTLAIKTLNLTNKTSFYFSLPRINVTKNLTQLLDVNAFVFVENITKGNKTFKLVKIFGNVSFNQSLIFANVFVRVKDPEGETIFEDETFSENFLFSFELLPKRSGTYVVEIFAKTELGNASKSLSFDVFKHLRLKPNIKQEKFNYGLGERATFEIELEEELSENNKVKVYLIDPEGSEKEVEFYEKDGKYFVDLDFGRSFRPGLYKLKVKTIEEKFVEKGRAPFKVLEKVVEVLEEEETEFGVGLVVVNTPKSIYLVNETARIIIGVVNEVGKRVTDAKIDILVHSPSEKIYRFSTSTNSVISNEDGTYEAYLKDLDEVGNYTIFVVVNADNFVVNQSSFFEVRSFVEIDVEREMPTLSDIASVFEVKLKITPRINISNVSVIETIPKGFPHITAKNARIESGEKEYKIIWNFDKLTANEKIELVYSVENYFESPIIFEFGPLIINSSEAGFVELKEWDLIVTDVIYYAIFWEFYRDSEAVHHMALCRGMNYTIRFSIVDTAMDEDMAANQLGYLRIRLENEGSFQTLPYKGFISQNPQTVQRTRNDVTTCSATADTDPCVYNLVWYLNISKDAPVGLHTLQLYLSSTPQAPRYLTDRINIYVTDCDPIGLVRDALILGPQDSVEVDQKAPNFYSYRVIAGSLARFVLPLKNYGSETVNANVSIRILSGENEVNWYFPEGDTQSITLSPNTEKIVVWRTWVPDDAAGTYTALFTIQTQDKTVTIQRNFEVYTFPIVIYQASPDWIIARRVGVKYRTVSVCNYGDYNLTVNITEINSMQGGTTVTAYPTANITTSTRV
ncbi:MAG: hypothetical protein QW140_01255, partial [Candidatus Aenigmatarchaeota archaeon]